MTKALTHLMAVSPARRYGRDIDSSRAERAAVDLLQSLGVDLSDERPADTPRRMPGERVIGLSKLARVVELFARDLQVQERLTTQVADWLQETLVPKGAGVVLFLSLTGGNRG